MGELAYLRSSPPEQIAFPWPEDFRPQQTEKARAAAPVAQMGTHDLTRAIHLAIRNAFDGQDSPVKRLARAANSNERAAKGWWEGDNLPGAIYLLRLMAEVPELAAEVRRLTGMQADLDPELDAALQQAMQLFVQIKGRGR